MRNFRIAEVQAFITFSNATKVGGADEILTFLRF
jgi:hypothetical protein